MYYNLNGETLLASVQHTRRYPPFSQIVSYMYNCINCIIICTKLEYQLAPAQCNCQLWPTIPRRFQHLQAVMTWNSPKFFNYFSTATFANFSRRIKCTHGLNYYHPQLKLKAYFLLRYKFVISLEVMLYATEDVIELNSKYIIMFVTQHHTGILITWRVLQIGCNQPLLNNDG